VAIALAEAGAQVVVNCFRQDAQAEEVVAIIRSHGSNSFAVKADVAKEEEVRDLFRRAIDEFGAIDLLVSNSGIQRDAPFDEMSMEQWDQVISVNLTASRWTLRRSNSSAKNKASPTTARLVSIWQSAKPSKTNANADPWAIRTAREVELLQIASIVKYTLRYIAYVYTKKIHILWPK